MVRRSSALMHRADSASLSMEANDLEQVLGTLREQALELDARYNDQVNLHCVCPSSARPCPMVPTDARPCTGSCARRRDQHRFLHDLEPSLNTGVTL